jgi:hypothetical protein
MAMLLAVSPAAHALTDSHQHGGSLMSMSGENKTQSGHHDHSAHEHGSKIFTQSPAATETKLFETRDKDDDKTCCHSSGGVCAYLVPIEVGKIFGDGLSVLIAGRRATPHLSYLLPTTPPPRRLG